jgi:hypothetical protein
MIPLLTTEERAIHEGALITARPSMPTVDFNPPVVSIGFYEDWHRLDFKLRARRAALDTARNGFLTFSVEGIIVADIPLSVYITARPSTIASPVSRAVSPYQTVFCSYSHRDEAIVAALERAYRVLGWESLRDAITLRAGERWQDGLFQMIDRSDVFQLFWSSHAAESSHVRDEWRYAMNLGRHDERFIRPVYWDDPMPPAPPELQAVHFVFEPTLVWRNT